MPPGRGSPPLFSRVLAAPFGDAAVEGGEGVGEDLELVAGGVLLDEGELVEEGLEGGGFGRGAEHGDGEGLGGSGSAGKEMGDGLAGRGAEGDVAAAGLVEGGFLEAELGGEFAEGEAGDAEGVVDEFAGGWHFISIWQRA